MKRTKKVISLLLALALLLTLLPAAAYADVTGAGTEDDPYVVTARCDLETKMAGASDPVSYIDADGVTQSRETYTVFSNQTSLANNQWYVVSADAAVSSLYVSGTAHLILCDGVTLTVTGGVRVPSGSTLNIYAQSTSYFKGKLVSNTSDAKGAGIEVAGTLVICGGDITATGADYGILAGNQITVLGGSVTATGGNKGIWGLDQIALGWRSPADRIYASSYEYGAYGNGGSLLIAAGRYLYNGEEVLGGTVTDLTKVNDKTLQPAVKITLPEGVTAAGTEVINQTDGTYALPGAAVTLDAGEGLALAGAPTVQTAGGSSVTVTESGGAYTFTMPAEDVTVTAVLKPAGPAGILGDVDGDGVVSFVDISALYMYITGITGEFVRENADINGDGVITYSDVTNLYMYLVGATTL